MRSYQYVLDIQLSHDDSVSCMPLGPDPLSDMFVSHALFLEPVVYAQLIL